MRCVKCGNFGRDGGLCNSGNNFSIDIRFCSPVDSVAGQIRINLVEPVRHVPIDHRIDGLQESCDANEFYAGQECIGGLAVGRVGGVRFVVALMACVGLMLPVAMAQTAGDGAITGTVTDSTGAVVPNATVTAHNVATGVDTTRVTSSAGVYQISPIIIGTYSLTVTATGFGKFTQENIVINQNQIFGLNPVIKVGSQNDTVTVTEAPPQLDTANATLGDTISSSEFANLPLMVAGNQQRDITSFSNLLPGAQAWQPVVAFFGHGEPCAGGLSGWHSADDDQSDWGQPSDFQYCSL